MRFRIPLLQLLACTVSVGLCVALYALSRGTGIDSSPRSWLLNLGIQVLTCWVAIISFDEGGRELRTWFDRFFTAVGFTLLVQYGLAYLFYTPLLPWAILLGGSGLAVTVITLLASPEQHNNRAILLLGLDSATRAVAPVLRDRIVGVIDDQPEGITEGLPFLGPVKRLAQAVAEKRPRYVVVSEGDRRIHVPARQLLRFRYAGIDVEPSSTFYESVFSRVHSEALDPFNLLFSSAFMASRTAMAVQAVYTNVIALGLLLVLSPVLLLIAILLAISSGAGALERIQCPGFQQIPFRLLRFRTRTRNGDRMWIGDWITRLGLVNLPQLINVARGEMTLVGPPPVRAEFAEHLLELMPVYGHRFTVRPGILGWSQVNLRKIQLPDERLRLEYDLYYVKQGSPSMDLDIFFRTLFRISVPQELNRVPGAS